MDSRKERKAQEKTINTEFTYDAESTEKTERRLLESRRAPQKAQMHDRQDNRFGAFRER
jgi:hypothetical protein